MANKPEKQIWVMGRRGWMVFRRMGVIWLLTLVAALVIILCERAALGAVVHGRLVANLCAFLFLAGAADGVASLFQAGWFRFTPQGFGYHIPWRGSRDGLAWDAVNFAAIVPGEVAMAHCQVALLFVGHDGSASALEYRRGMIQRLLPLCPNLRVAALHDDREVTRICHGLDAQGVGWLPLTWVQHPDGTGELVLRAMARQEDMP